jgi:ArsR family metal-binding transcriptional regulator
MATRTVRLDDEAEEALREVQDATGLPISEALKRGLRSLQQRVRDETKRTPFDVYRQLDLGSGGYAVAPSTRTRRAVRRVVRRKLSR